MTVKKYVRLLAGFVGNTVSVTEFERAFLAMFKAEQGDLDPSYAVLGSLFEDVDAFHPNSKLHEEGDVSESELRELARRTLERDWLAAGANPSPREGTS